MCSWGLYYACASTGSKHPACHCSARECLWTSLLLLSCFRQPGRRRSLMSAPFSSLRVFLFSLQDGRWIEGRTERSGRPRREVGGRGAARPSVCLWRRTWAVWGRASKASVCFGLARGKVAGWRPTVRRLRLSSWLCFAGDLSWAFTVPLVCGECPCP